MFVGRNLIAGQWREGAGVNQEEMFSQTTCVLAVGDLDEAITVANDTPYGLTAAIATRSLARATGFHQKSRSGCVMGAAT
jgi:alpha-ketoglutaric semialdehyde dehydrogenase